LTQSKKEGKLHSASWAGGIVSEDIFNRSKIMRRVIYFVMILFVTALLAESARAQDLVVYPAKGQSQEQMEKDKFECYSWAKEQSGFDPMQMPTASSPPPPKGDKSVAGGVVGGGVVGGVGGAMIGGIAGGRSGAKKGAAIGGLSGGALGGMRSNSQNQEANRKRQQWEREQTNQYLQQRNTYNRNYAACLEGRGYSVK
jgi:predicted lipid-binding transport protein (Tim44 family)